MGVDLKITARVEGKFTGAAGISSPEADVDLRAILAFVTGTATGQADRLYSATRTLAASGSESLDLAGGLTDPLGGAATFATVNVLAIRAHATNTNDVVVGGAASNGFATPFGDATDKVKVRPGGVLLLACDGGYAVTAATADLLQVANGGGTTGVGYDVLILGRSA